MEIKKKPSNSILQRCRKSFGYTLVIVVTLVFTGMYLDWRVNVLPNQRLYMAAVTTAAMTTTTTPVSTTPIILEKKLLSIRARQLRLKGLSGVKPDKLHRDNSAFILTRTVYDTKMGNRTFSKIWNPANSNHEKAIAFKIQGRPRAKQKRPVKTVKVTSNNGFLYFETKIGNVSTVLKVKKEALDIMNMSSIPFDPDFKNPCFYGNQSNQLFSDEKLHCLPYFYIIGVKKSGTTDLYARLSRHPQFIHPINKEPQWFPRIRFRPNVDRYPSLAVRQLVKAGFDNKNVSFYISLYDNVAKMIESRGKTVDGKHYHSCVTADATPANLHMNKYWELLPGNENLKEPKYTNLDYIKHLVPNVKIIVIFRDPVTRLFSDYLHTCLRGRRPASVSQFHSHSFELTKTYTECLKRHTLRQCVYNNTLVDILKMKGVPLGESFMSSFYVVFMKDLYRVFGKENVLPVLTSDYIMNMSDVLQKVFKFLKLGRLTPRQLSKALVIPVQNKSRKSRKIGPMLNSTRDLLYKFFKPFNEKMAVLMNDDRYLFPPKY